MAFHWSLSESKSPQVSVTLLSILAVLNSAVVWMVSTRSPTSKSSSPFNNPLVTVWKSSNHDWYNHYYYYYYCLEKFTIHSLSLCISVDKLHEFSEMKYSFFSCNFYICFSNLLKFISLLLKIYQYNILKWLYNISLTRFSLKWEFSFNKKLYYRVRKRQKADFFFIRKKYFLMNTLSKFCISTLNALL